MIGTSTSTSFLWKGTRLERRLGGAWFLYLLSAFSLLTGLVYLPLQAWLTKLIQEPDPLWHLIDASAHSSECAVGFSARDPQNNDGTSDLRPPLSPDVRRTSLIGHLSGILVGLLYTLGPLKIVMETCADINDPRPSTYFSSSGHSGTGPECPQHAEDRTAEDRTAEDRTAEDRTAEDRTAEDRTAEDRTTDDSSDYIKTDLDRMTEEEQIELAIRNSLNDRGPTRRRRTAQSHSGFHPTEEEASPEEIRRRRLRRLEEEFYHQRRRTHFMDL